MNWRLTLTELAALALAFTLAGCATTPGGKVADGAVHADHVSTGLALVINEAAREANPLWPLGPVRYVANHYVEGERCALRDTVHTANSVVGLAAAANNLGVAAGWTLHPLLLVPGGLLGWWLAERNECEPYLEPAHRKLLAEWERAYEAGDLIAVRALTDNEALVSKYAGMFSATTDRQVTYSRPESVRGGLIVHFEARFVYPERTSERAGELRFQINEAGEIVKIG